MIMGFDLLRTDSGGGYSEACEYVGCHEACFLHRQASPSPLCSDGHPWYQRSLWRAYRPKPSQWAVWRRVSHVDWLWFYKIWEHMKKLIEISWCVIIASTDHDDFKGWNLCIAMSLEVPGSSIWGNSELQFEWVIGSLFFNYCWPTHELFQMIWWFKISLCVTYMIDQIGHVNHQFKGLCLIIMLMSRGCFKFNCVGVKLRHEIMLSGLHTLGC